MSLSHPLRQGLVYKLTKPAVGNYSYISTTSEASLLLVGADTGIKDLSKNNWAFGNVTGITTSTTQTKFRSISLDFGTAWATLTSSSGSAEFNFGTGDFTFEYWIWYKDSTVGRLGQSIRFGTSSGFVAGGGGRARMDVYMGATGIERAISPALSTGTWHHQVITRLSGVAYFYTNGTQVHSQALTASGSVPWNVSLAADDNGPAVATNVFLSEYRIVKGVALYQGTQYEVPTAALTTSSLQISIWNTSTSYGVNQTI